MADDLEARRRRAAYRAGHRGTKEMDWLLGRFGAAAIADMQESELALFEHFIALPDPKLHDWIMAPQSLDAAQYAPLIKALRQHHKF